MATIPTTTTSENASGKEIPKRSLSRLWQLPFFLLAVAGFLYVYWHRPFQRHDSGPRLFERDLAAIRTLLTRSAAEVPSALNLAERAREQVARYPHRTGEVAFLLGSAHLRRAETHDNPILGREHLLLARKELEIAGTQQVPENDRARLPYRLARTLFLLEESPERVVQLLEPVVEKADDAAEGYLMLSRAYLRLPTPNHRAALEANERLRQVPLAGEELLAQARFEAGELLLQLKQSEEARKVLQKIGEKAPPSLLSRARWLRAQSLQEEGRYGPAATLWQEAATDPREPAANRGRIYFNLGYCYRRLDQPEAVSAWEDCLRSGNGPEQRAAAVLLSDLQLQQNQAEKALESVEKALVGVENSGDWKNDLVDLNRVLELCERALTASRTNQREVALRWTRVYQKVATPGRAEQFRAELLTQSGRETLAALASADPATAPQLKEQGYQQLREAARTYALAAEKTPDPAARADQYWNASALAAEIDERELSSQWLIRLIQVLEPAGSDPGAGTRIPGAFERKGRAWYQLGEVLRQSNSPKAEEAYRNCVVASVSPYNYRAKYQLAIYALQRGEVDDAAEMLRQNLFHLRFQDDREAKERSLFALGGIYFNQSKYHEVVRILEEALGRFPANPEATRAHLQLAQSYRMLSAQQNLTALTNISRSEQSRAHFAREHRRWLTKAATEFTELARFLEAPESTGHLTQEERVQIPFIAAECRFDLGQYEDALAIYDHLADRHKGTEEALNALGGAVRCHAALGQSEQLRRRLTDIRSQLNLLSETVRAPWEEWLTIAGKPTTGESNRPSGEGAPATGPSTGSNKPMSPYQAVTPGQPRTTTPPENLQPSNLQPGQLQPAPGGSSPERIVPSRIPPE